MCQTHARIGSEYLKPLETRNPDFEKRIRESFSCQPFMVTIAASLSRIEPGRVDISVPFADHITQQHGCIHGGVIGAIAGNAAGYAAYSLINSEDSVLTVEYKLTLLATAKGERVEVRAEVMRPGRALTVVRSDVSAYDDGMEMPCATAVVTLIRMAGRSDQRGG